MTPSGRRKFTDLSSSGLCMLLLDLNLDDVAWVLDDLRYKSRMSSSNLSGDSLSQIDNTSISPVLIENASARAEGRKILGDHAPNAVHGPKHKKYDEQMMRIPEPFKVRSAWLFNRGKYHCHQACEHNPASPCRASQKTCP